MSTSHTSADRFAAGLLLWFENHAAQGLFTTDRDLNIRTWNRWMATNTSLDADEVIGRPVLEIIPSLAERGLDAHYREALCGQAKVLSHTLHRYLVPCPQPDGTMMPQSGRIAPLMDGEDVVGTITLVSDVSDRVASERQLRAQIAAADDARLQAEAASRAKDEFLATLSHEIRTPLSAVLGWIHLLKVRDPDAATIKRAVEVIERNAKSQLTLISDMLDMARISSGKVRLELSDVNMTQVVCAALDAVRPAADAKNIKVVTDLPGMAAVSGDADRLLQVTWNVLSNAVKFTGDGGMVVVSLRSDRTGTHLAVADTGQGIDPKFLGQVFERFKQADTSAGRRSGGLGLGLALVKDLVTMHGGSVEAASPGPGLGSTFSIHLPNRLEGADNLSARPAIKPTETTLDGVRVLVVEDDPDAREIAERSITDAGGTTIGAGNAIEALAAIAHAGAAPPHVLVSDIGLPGTDGYDLLEAIRNLPTERGAIPAIAVTAYAGDADAQLAIKRGFVAHITKPYSPAALVTAVRDAIDQRPR